MQNFLRSSRLKYPFEADLIWLLSKIKQCLINHSNGSDYFYEVERLKTGIERDYLACF